MPNQSAFPRWPLNHLWRPNESSILALLVTCNREDLPGARFAVTIFRKSLPLFAYPYLDTLIPPPKEHCQSGCSNQYSILSGGRWKGPRRSGARHGGGAAIAGGRAPERARLGAGLHAERLELRSQPTKLGGGGGLPDVIDRRGQEDQVHGGGQCFEGLLKAEAPFVHAATSCGC